MTLSPLLALAFLAACDRKDARIPVGAVVCETGDAATLGLTTLRGYDLAVEEWNARGGVLGRRVRLVPVDSRSDPAEAALAMAKVIERDRAVAVLGPILSKEVLAAGPIAQASRVPILVTATHPGVRSVGNRVFQVSLADDLQGRMEAELCRGHLKARTAACLFDLGDDYTQGLAECFRATFQRLGGQVTAFEGHASGATDFRAQLTKILPGRPDVLFIPDFYGSAALIARQARELGWQGQLLGSEVWDSPNLLKLGGDALEGAVFVTSFCPEALGGGGRAFFDAYRARFRQDPDVWAAIGWDAGQILLGAIQAEGSLDPDRIRTRIESTEHQGVTGLLRFGKGHGARRTLHVMRIVGGHPRHQFQFASQGD